MASTTAMFTALSGLNASSRTIDVVGNNIANVNTTGYKSSRAQFSDRFYRTMRGASAPGDTNGGSNPAQVGLGVNVAGVSRSFTQGSLGVTGDAGDMAIEGEGFFVVSRGGTQYYTRAGNFRLDANNELVSPDGSVVQGYAADEDFNISTGGTLSSISIPIGNRTIAEATSSARFSGNLDASGTVATSGTQLTIGGTAAAGLRVVATAVPAPGAGQQILGASLLTDIEVPSAPGSGTSLFAVGQIIELSEARRGTAAIAKEQYTITAASTVNDLNAFLSQSLGIQTGAANPDGATPGVTIDPATGLITVVGNTGTVNNLTLASANLRLLDSAGTLISTPLTSMAVSSANGESVRTSIPAFDSLGNLVEVNVSMVLQSKNATGGTTWRYFVDSPDDADPTTVMASGTVLFDDEGQLATTAPITVTMERNSVGSPTGASTPLTFDLVLADGNNIVTSLATRSILQPSQVDGLPPGTLESFSVGRDGTVFGIFSNSAVRTLAQVAVATFVNPSGLSAQGSNLFAVSPNSGCAGDDGGNRRGGVDSGTLAGAVERGPVGGVHQPDFGLDGVLGQLAGDYDDRSVVPAALGAGSVRPDLAAGAGNGESSGRSNRPMT